MLKRSIAGPPPLPLPVTLRALRRRFRGLAPALALAWLAPLATAGEVRILSTPEGAVVSVGGIAYGTTGPAGLLLDLPDGPAALHIEKDGLLPVDKTVVVSGTAPVVVMVRLTEESPATDAAAPVSATGETAPALAPPSVPELPATQSPAPPDGVAAAAAVPSAASASLQDRLSSEDIAAGLAWRGETLDLQDTGRGLMNALAAMNGPSSSPSGRGFSLLVYTPQSWVAKLHKEAERRFQTLAAQDLSDADTADVLRVVVFPDTPIEVTASGTWHTDSVQHVVLRDARKTEGVVVQPLSIEPFAEEAQNAFGARLEYKGLVATFPMAALRPLCARDKKGEFHVTVIGNNSRKDFKIKQKHLSRLPGL